MLPLLTTTIAVVSVLLQATANEEFRVEHGALIKFSPDCDKWAKDDNECLNNPNFMWTKCHSSCMEFARDLSDQCPTWAEEGECTHNPGYIQLHCPESCNFALGWSPYMRHHLNMDRLPVVNVLTNEECHYPLDVFGAAQLMKYRLDRIVFLGGASSVVGMSFDAPTEYLGMLGIAEGILYAMRLYSVVISAAEDEIMHHLSAVAEDPEHAHLHEEIIQTLDKIRKEQSDSLEDITHTLSQGYESDRVTRSIPTWMKYLGTITSHLI
jgi:ShK domain-like